jgi:NAD(P)H-hydrate epimerase
MPTSGEHNLEVVDTLPRLPRRRPDSHKGDFGRVLVIAGSRGMAGAAALIGASALRCGAGLVRVACPHEVQPTVASFEPSYMTWPLPQDADGCIDYPAAAPHLKRWLDSADVLALGPGLGSGASLRAFVTWLLESFDRPIVLDADGLNALEGDCGPLSSRPWPLVITPHPGELARLTGISTSEVQASRIESARRLVEAYGNQLVVVLKGHETIVLDARRLYVNHTGNPGMATGGSGDCLTGAIAALIGQQLPPFEASVLGVHAHGLAGDMAANDSGQVGMIAGDIVEQLADALYHLGDDE